MRRLRSLLFKLVKNSKFRVAAGQALAACTVILLMIHTSTAATLDLDCRRYEQFSTDDVLAGVDPWARRCRLFVDGGTVDRNVPETDPEALEIARMYSDYEFGHDNEAIERAQSWLAQNPGRIDSSKYNVLRTLARAAKISGDRDLAVESTKKLLQMADSAPLPFQSFQFRNAELIDLKLPAMQTFGDGTTVSARMSSQNTLNVPIQIAGKTVEAVADTGAEMSTISDSLAHQLGLEIIEGARIPFMQIFGQPYYASLAIAPEIRIGDLRIENARFIVTNPLKHDARMADFVLGLNLLHEIGRFGFIDQGKRVAFGNAAPDVDCLGGKGILFRHKDGIGLSVTLDGKLAPAHYDTGFSLSSTYEAPLSFYAPSRRIRKFSQGPGKIERSPLVIGAFREFDFEMAGAPVKDRNVRIFRSQDPDRKLDFPLTVGGSTTRRLEALVLDFRTMRYAAVKESSPQTEACFAAASARAH